MTTASRTKRTLTAAFAPRRRITVSEWAKQNVRLPHGTTTRPGPIHFEWCPEVIEPMNRYTDPEMRKLSLCFATRAGKTEIFMCQVRYSVAEEYEARLWGKPNQDDAEKDSEGRFRPVVESSPILFDLKPNNPHHYRKALMRFKTGPVYFVGAGSPAKTRNVQIGRLWLDEIDVMRRASDRETGALENFMERIKEHPSPKIMLSSTPTVSSAQIWKEFIKGDQRFYWMPCPFCNGFLRFERGGLRWSDAARKENGTWDPNIVAETVHYLCPHCAKHILEQHKLPMLKAGQWRPTPEADRITWEGRIIPREAGHFSYHLNSLYTTRVPFARFATTWVTAQNDPEARQSFVNQWEARPYFDFGDSDEMKIALGKARQDAGATPSTLPEGYRALLWMDVSRLECWVRVRCFNASRDSIGLEFANTGTLEDAEVLRKKWAVPLAAIDIGYADRREEVLEFCHLHRPHWFVTHGSGTMFAPYKRGEILIAGGNLKGVPIPLLKVNPHTWKEILFERIKGGKDGQPKWVNEPTLSESYQYQMGMLEMKGQQRGGEVRKVRTKPNGTRIVEWVRIGPNHAWDCEYNLLAMFDLLGSSLFPQRVRGQFESPVPKPDEGQTEDLSAAAQAGRRPKTEEGEDRDRFPKEEDYERYGGKRARPGDRDEIW
jgi:hypothetical protein